MLLHDLRYAFRLVLRRPGFALIGALTLALGIGANTAIFTVIDRVMLRAVPFPQPDRLVVVWETNPGLPVPVMVASPPTLDDWQTRNRSFDAIGAFRWRSVTLAASPGQFAEPEQVRGASVTAGLLRTLAVQPVMGRLFLDEEDRPNARGVVLISDALWRRRFQSRRDVLGQPVSIDGVPHEIVGVMPPGYVAPPPVVFRGSPPADRAELWVPLAIDLAGGQRGAHNLVVVARLRSGTSIDAADRDIKRIAGEVAREHPDYSEWNARVVPLDGWVTETSRRSMTLLGGAVVFVLMLACANVANLLLARGVGRRREFAIRTALGAARGRLAAQVVAESIALGIIGGLAGVAMAAILVRLIGTLGPATIPGVREATLDVRALSFALAISLIAAVAAALAPAFRIVTASLKEWLTERAGGPGAGAARVQKTLVVAQVAFAVVLLVGASLLVESFRNLQAVDTGFRPEHVVTGKIVLPASRYADANARIALVDRLLANVRSAAAIQAVGVSDAVPLADNRQGTSFSRADAAVPESSAASHSNFAYVSDGFFEALGMRLIRGRTFTDRDRASTARVVVINERLARQAFGGDDPIGRLVRVGTSTQAPFEVIGLVADDHHIGVDTDPTATFFLSFRQLPSAREVAVLARGFGEAGATIGVLRTAIRSLDAEMPFYQVQTMEHIVETSMATPRSLAWLLSGFGLTGLTLAAIGLFGVLSHAVGQRTQEIGVRMAVGADPSKVLRMVVGDGLLQVALGLVGGTLISLGASSLLQGLLFGVNTASPWPYVVVAALLLSVGVISCLAPARRAMKIDPVAALRAD